MMVQFNLRLDEEVKRDAEKTLGEIGLSMSTAINIFLRAVVRENRIPFELSADPILRKDHAPDFSHDWITSGEKNPKEHGLNRDIRSDD